MQSTQPHINRIPSQSTLQVNGSKTARMSSLPAQIEVRRIDSDSLNITDRGYETLRKPKLSKGPILVKGGKIEIPGGQHNNLPSLSRSGKNL